MIRKYCRALWKKPELNDMKEERSVNWIELFYDLVFVVLISKLSHKLLAHPGWDTALEYTFLFLAVWFTWISSVYYFDLAKVTGLRLITATFVKMISVGVMTLFIENALTDGSFGFAIGYIIHHGLIVLLFYDLWKHNRHIEKARRGLPVVVIFYGISTILFSTSLLFSVNYRVIFWGVALFIDFLVPLVYTYRMADKGFKGSNKKLKMMERFGLLTIIVLGEGIIGIVSGLSHSKLTPELMMAGFIQFILVFSLWYIHFRTVEKRELRRAPWWRQVWTYLHFIMYTSMIMVGVSMLYLIEHYHKISGGKIYLVSFGIVMIVFALFEICLERNDCYEEEKKDYYIIFFAKLIGGITFLTLGILDVKFDAIELLIVLLSVTAVIVFLMLREEAREEIYLANK
ncbi:MAG: low temperature requirement protein A [Fusobacteriota bacterium]